MMYDPYGAMRYGGFQNPYAAMYQQPPAAQHQPAPAANALPPQQVLQANGKPSIDALRMAPNSSVLIMDTTAPIVWLCTSDSLGNVTPAAYDITPHKDAPPIDAGSFETRLAAVEGTVSTMLAKWEELTNGGKSDAQSAESK